MDYWNECISEALDDAGVSATGEQIDIIATWVKGAHENYGMAFGHDCIPNPLRLENEALKKELQNEKDKVVCNTCNGNGTITDHGPYHSATSSCHVCGGEGRYTL